MIETLITSLTERGDLYLFWRQATRSWSAHWIFDGTTHISDAEDIRSALVRVAQMTACPPCMSCLFILDARAVASGDMVTCPRCRCRYRVEHRDSGWTTLLAQPGEDTV